MTDAVLYDAREDGIAILTINRPDQRNCLSRDVREGLREAWARFEADDAMRIAILTGSGEKAFCAGGDLKEMVETGMKVPPRDMFPLPYDSIELSKPTIAAVNGHAMAGGWMIAQACDLCLVMGSSLVVYPAAAIPLLAKRNGARLAIVNREATPQDDEADLVVHGEIGPTLAAPVGVN